MWNEPNGSAPTPAQIRTVFAGLMLAMLLAALDQTIIAVALPRLGTELRGLDLLAWVVSGYLISAAVATPVFGKLGDLYGRRGVLSAAIGLFLAGALACATAQDMSWLIAGRVLQGAGGGGLIAVSQAVIADLVAPRERGRYQVYLSAVHVVSSVAGPLVGGLLTEYLSWRWVFWINLPLGAVALLVSRLALAGLAAPRERRPVDYAGAVLLATGLTVLLLAVTRVGQGVPALDGGQLAMYAAATLLLAAFAWWQGRAAEPLLPLSLLRIRTVSISCAILFVGFLQLVSLSMMVPLQHQLVAGLSPGAAALQLMPLTLGGPAGAWLAGKVMVRTGRTRALQAGGAAVVAAGVALMGLGLAPDSRAAPVLLAFIGLGIGCQFPTSLVAIQNAVPARHVGVATSTAAFSRSLGAAIGVAVLTAVLVAALGGQEPASGAALLRRLGTLAQAPADLPGRAETLAAAAAAFRRMFLVSAGIATAAFVLALRLPDRQLRSSA